MISDLCIRMRFILSSLLLLAASASTTLSGADLILLDKGHSNYQIVVPDDMAVPLMNECIGQTARLVQTAFKANGADVTIVKEAQRDAARPAIYLGSTRFAKEHGVDASKLEGWSYVQRAAGKDILIAGHDQPSPISGEPPSKRDPTWSFIGTAKGVTDFTRQFMGVRFLYPEIPHRQQINHVATIDLLTSTAIEFLPTSNIRVAGDLNVQKTPLLRINTSGSAGGSFYDIAHNRFPMVDEMYGSHTWERAIPAANYQRHPEYFALINGQRQNPVGGNAQFCLSNSDVQDLIYKDLVRLLDQGFNSVDLGQPDGFRECQCEKCALLYSTGKDWSEKIWIFNRSIAERLLKSHPRGHVTMMSYILTAKPPKTFKAFPANTRVMLTGTNEEDIAPWRDHEVLGGFTGYVYNWCPNLATRYTPMRTPAHVEAQAKRLVANRIQSIFRDGPGQIFGLEGPVYYTMGRMYDDPEHNSAQALVPEFCDAAFGKGSRSMQSFYDQLNHAIMLYSDHIGTRTDVWSYFTADGRKRKTVSDPFQLITFLYPPNLLSALDADLTQAEKLADTEKIKTRLALVRREFDYVRHLSRVVHLHQAFVMQPDLASRDRLLDAIDARNAAIDAFYGERGRTKAVPGWPIPLFPLSGHAASHLRLAHDGYQEPYANTCLNWDTKEQRNAPLPGKQRMIVRKVQAAPTLDSPEWQQATAQELTLLTPLHQAPSKTTLRILHDQTHLYIRAECSLQPESKMTFSGQRRDTDLRGKESLELYLSPQVGRDVAYRFVTGANAAAKYDAVSGLITDVMDPRHGKDDPTWNGEWQSESRVDAKEHRWQALIIIPFKTLAVEPPTPGTIWRANFARNHPAPRERVDRAIWSSSPGNVNMDDRSLFGEIVFEAP